MFMKALKLQYESEIEKAKDNIKVYLINPAGIGEHPDLASAVDSQIDALSHAEDKLEVLMKHFGDEVV
jgi:hypothetical protein|tara:strand:+ start:257 stop:460 length:204 start_codon:yes stop_codon:yes gene_type:complete